MAYSSETQRGKLTLRQKMMSLFDKLNTTVDKDIRELDAKDRIKMQIEICKHLMPRAVNEDGDVEGDTINQKDVTDFFSKYREQVN